MQSIHAVLYQFIRLVGGEVGKGVHPKKFEMNEAANLILVENIYVIRLYISNSLIV